MVKLWPCTYDTDWVRHKNNASMMSWDLCYTSTCLAWLTMSGSRAFGILTTIFPRDVEVTSSPVQSQKNEARNPRLDIRLLFFASCTHDQANEGTVNTSDDNHMSLEVQINDQLIKGFPSCIEEFVHLHVTHTFRCNSINSHQQIFNFRETKYAGKDGCVDQGLHFGNTYCSVDTNNLESELIAVW